MSSGSLSAQASAEVSSPEEGSSKDHMDSAVSLVILRLMPEENAAFAVREGAMSVTHPLRLWSDQP